MFKPPQSLVDAVRQQTIVPFIGAGISVGAVHGLAREMQFPDWPQLILRLATRLEDEQQLSDAAKVRAAPDTLAAAQIAVDALGRPAFLDEMRKAFDRPRAPVGADLSATAAIWRLRAPFVITTNYDPALGWPWDATEVQRIHNDDPTLLGSIDSAAGRKRRIWHLHGSIDRVDTIILTSKQYEKLYPPGSPKRLEYENAFNRFQQLLTTRPFLFLGYSLDEPLLRRLLMDILEITGKAVPPKYLLLRSGQADQAKQVEFRDTYNVHVIEFEGFGPPLVMAIDAIGREAWGDSIDASSAVLTSDMTALVADLLQQVQGLVVRPDDVARLYNACKPRAWEHALTGGDGVTLLRQVVVRLAEAVSPGADEPPPLLHFIDRLRADVAEPWLTRLTIWLDGALDRLAPTADARARMRHRLDAARDEAVAMAMHVLVRIATEAAGSGEWIVHAWAWSGTEIPEALFGPVGRRYADGSTGEVVYDLLDELEARHADPNRTSLAFLVPSRLAISAIHRWQLPAEVAHDPPIGATYTVTVRPLERLARPPLLRRRLKRAWEDFKKRATDVLALLDPSVPLPSGSVPAYLLDSAAARKPDIGVTLEQNGVRCVVLREAPCARAIDHLTALIDTTTPAILWCEDEFTNNVESAVRTLLQSVPVADLPRRVREERAAAFRGENDRMRLTLMWDDADRLPPEYEPTARARVETT